MTTFLVLRCAGCRTIDIRTQEEDRMATRRCGRVTGTAEDQHAEQCKGNLELLFTVDK